MICMYKDGISSLPHVCVFVSSSHKHARMHARSHKPPHARPPDRPTARAEIGKSKMRHDNLKPDEATQKRDERMREGSAE